MIIRSMSRKDATFGALVAYVARVDAADHRFALRHNIWAQDQAAVVAELEANGRLLKARKNGVVMYHEIISITRAKGISAEAQKRALRTIAHRYINARAPQCLAYGQLHTDHSDHLHYHIVISSNAAGESRRHSLTKAKFRAIQVGIEQHVLTNYPQLEQSLAIGKKAQQRQSQAGCELMRRTGKKSQVEAIKVHVAQVFAQAQTADDLFQKLTDARLELYRRGKAVGLRDLDRERNHRLETLGLTGAFETMSQRFQTQAAVRQAVPQKATTMTLNPAAALIPSAMQTAGPSAKALAAAKAAKPSIAAKLAGPDPQTAQQMTAGLAPAAVGGVAKAATGIMEIAVQQVGGPKQHVPSAQMAQTQTAQPAPVQGFNPSNEVDRLAELRKLEAAKKAKPMTDYERAVAESRQDLEQFHKQQAADEQQNTTRLKL
jgi:Relaxase/Mobilisation nuclease domain